MGHPLRGQPRAFPHNLSVPHSKPNGAIGCTHAKLVGRMFASGLAGTAPATGELIRLERRVSHFGDLAVIQVSRFHASPLMRADACSSSHRSTTGSRPMHTRP
jgi:hypothetical protein